MTASLILALDWRIGISGFPLTVWLTVGWLLLAAGAAVLLAFLIRLLWYSLAESIAVHSALPAVLCGITADEETQGEASGLDARPQPAPSGR